MTESELRLTEEVEMQKQLIEELEVMLLTFEERTQRYWYLSNVWRGHIKDHNYRMGDMINAVKILQEATAYKAPKVFGLLTFMLEDIIMGKKPKKSLTKNDRRNVISLEDYKAKKKRLSMIRAAVNKQEGKAQHG